MYIIPINQDDYPKFDSIGNYHLLFEDETILERGWGLP